MPTEPLHLRRCPVTFVDGFEVICINGNLSVDGQLHLPHETCGGSGYQFPSLGRDCPNPGIYAGPCKRGCMCDGTGRIVNYTVEALLVAVGSLPEDAFVRFWETISKLVGWGSLDIWRWLTTAPEPDRIGHLKAAIEAAMEETDE